MALADCLGSILRRHVWAGFFSSHATLVTLRYVGKLYTIERAIKEQSADERYAVRQRDAKPVLDEFKARRQKHLRWQACVIRYSSLMP